MLARFSIALVLTATVRSIGSIAVAQSTTDQKKSSGDANHTSNHNTNDKNCCLCSDCDMMMNAKNDLYDIDQQMFVSCERFAEEIFRVFAAGTDQCNAAQSLFQGPCCLASSTMMATSTTTTTSQTTATSSNRRELFSNMSILSPSTSSRTTYPFQSSSLSKPAYSSWNAAQQSIEQTPVTTRSGSSTSSTPVYYAPPASSSGTTGQCPRVSGTCDFKCPTVPADRLQIHVSIDSAAIGRTDIPYFGAMCGDVQNQLHCQNVKTTDVRCSLLVARFRAECGCGGYQNNAAAFYGGTTPSNGAVGWSINTNN